MSRRAWGLSNRVLMDTYYAWLCGLIRVNQDNKSFGTLVSTLYQKKFNWSVPNDDNRAFEAKNIRERFCDEWGIEYILDMFPEKASMLEVIIALAYRCEESMVDSSCDRPMYTWFWELLSNVGLDEYTDYNYNDLRGYTKVDVVLNRIINRTYERNGRGGLFPLKSTRKDQRKVELWYQMNTYLVENYYNDDAVV